MAVKVALFNNLFSMPSKTDLKRNKKLTASLSSNRSPKANMPISIAKASKVDSSATVLAKIIVVAGTTILSMNSAGSLKIPLNPVK